MTLDEALGNSGETKYPLTTRFFLSALNKRTETSKNHQLFVFGR